MRRLTLGLTLILGASGLGSQPAPGNAIRVDVDGFHSGKGQAVCALYASADGFAKDGSKARAQIRSAISNGHGICEFAGIPAGDYAVSVFHDENANGKLDTNLLGIPREGVGASNNAAGHFGPPKFEDAAFAFKGGRLDVKITLRYL